MEPTKITPIKIECIPTKYLVGICKKMSLSEDNTSQLWQQFMQVMQKEHQTSTIKSSDLYSVEYFPCSLQHMTNSTLFDKWAAVEVDKDTIVPENLTSLTIQSGLYAVFIHHGGADLFIKTLETIFTQWLPSSGYQYDNRPQFEIMKENYSPNDPNATEEIWIPIVKVKTD